MNTLETAIRLMRPGCYMTSIDLKDAYYSIPIAEEHQKYLRGTDCKYRESADSCKIS